MKPVVNHWAVDVDTLKSLIRTGNATLINVWFKIAMNIPISKTVSTFGILTFSVDTCFEGAATGGVAVIVGSASRDSSSVDPSVASAMSDWRFRRAIQLTPMMIRIVNALYPNKKVVDMNVPP